MEIVSYNSQTVTMEDPIVSILVKAVVVDSVLAAQKAFLCFLVLAEGLLKNENGLLDLIGGDQRFPVDELHRRKRPEPENVDGSDTEDDDEDDDDAEQDDDEGDEDFSGEEGGEDDEEGDPEEDPVANGNGGSDDEDEGDDDDGDDEDGDDDEDEEDEDDEDEEDAPPAKKRNKF
ncbi:prostatic spermine-binding protein-like [Heracleum sosnowskyi]|uniref:Prostatic spermine-binding protein-like n=1 Tax=Heracleum sosnowskyi TaxID=360622 RepID=A0AAD8N358_9APIA|nr:prostatic spermine-binding protein-like [Heracleum sosnowskyi]